MVQSEPGVLTFIPSSMIHEPIQSYHEGEWIQFPEGVDCYVFLHDMREHPVPEDRIDKVEYILFVHCEVCYGLVRYGNALQFYDYEEA